ncbi:PAS domain-containing protein [uncultured Olleya sp.]|uniref:sensor histidine kinase n=1 Tax=uncultured Olleya sp. TaxID=757243 RepID=UPI002596EECF|nr:PAS domain-containing protein [uncultured Olleya sp.]
MENQTIKNQKWHFALENSGIGVWDWNSKTNEVFYSKESKKILGFQDHEIGSKPSEWDDRVHREDKLEYFEDFNNHINGKISEYVNVHRVLHKDNSYRWILDKGKVVERDFEGKPTRIIGTHTDITKQKETELALKKSIDLTTSQNNKLKSFAHIVTHNLKSHAGNFESILNLNEEVESDTEKQELYYHLRTISKSLTKTLKNLNQVVSIQTQKNSIQNRVNVSHEINTVIEELNFIISESSAVIYNDIDEECVINFDSTYLHSIVQNLITNSINYKHPDRPPVIKIKTESCSENLVLTISDNGLGIDLGKFKDKIFGLYKTFHNNPEAEGVGLYLIKNQIEAYGGTIDIDSQVNIGTTFKIVIPIHKKIQL